MKLLPSHPPTRSTNGFTLVELMIVVAIIGLLAAIAFPNFVRAREASRNAAFIADLRTACTAFQVYAIENRGYPPNSGAGVMPAGMGPYLDRFPWIHGTPLGGRWNWDNNINGYKAGVAVGSPQVSPEQLEAIDLTIDNGLPGSGLFRNRPGGYVYIIEE